MCAAPDAVRNASFERSTRYWHVAGFQPPRAWVASGPDHRAGVLEITQAMMHAPLRAQAGDATGAWQCIPLSSARSFDFGESVFIPPGQQQEGHATISVTFWKSTKCSDRIREFDDPDPIYVINTTTEEISATGQWIEVRACATRPPNAVAVQIDVTATNTTMSPAGTFVALFDDVFFAPRTSDCPERRCAIPPDRVQSARLPGVTAPSGSRSGTRVLSRSRRAGARDARTGR